MLRSLRNRSPAGLYCLRGLRSQLPAAWIGYFCRDHLRHRYGQRCYVGRMGPCAHLGADPCFPCATSAPVCLVSSQRLKAAAFGMTAVTVGSAGAAKEFLSAVPLDLRYCIAPQPTQAVSTAMQPCRGSCGCVFRSDSAVCRPVSCGPEPPQGRASGPVRGVHILFSHKSKR